MPVTLEEVDHARWGEDPQVGIDLARIYQDAEADWLPLPVDAFIRDHLESGGVFHAALFNDRLLGAVSVRKSPEAWWLSHFCVRRPTRRRGVGSRLMTLVAAAAGETPLRIETRHLPLESQLLLVRMGYRLEEGGGFFELKTPPAGGSQ